MTTAVEKNGGNLSLTVCGRLDTVTAPQLEEQIKENINGVTALVFVCDGLDYISSAGLRVLLSAQKIMSRQGSMVLRGVNSSVREIFDVTGFSDFLTIE